MGYPAASPVASNVNGGSGSKMFLCCTVHVWCKVIAWLEMIFTLFVALLCWLALIVLNAVVFKEWEEEIKSGQPPLIPGTENKMTMAVLKFLTVTLNTILVVVSVVILVRFVFALMLLRGTNRKNRCFLWTWIVIAAIYIVFLFVSLFSFNGPWDSTKIPLLVIQMLVQAFFLYPVYVRVREIQDDNGNNEVTAVGVYGGGGFVSPPTYAEAC